jgi:hypothetical protein
MQALRSFDSNVKGSYKLGMHGVMWEFFRGMYLVPSPLLRGYTSWGETNIPPVILSSIPGTMSQVKIAGINVLQSYPVLSLGCSMGEHGYIYTTSSETHDLTFVSSSGVNACVTTYEDRAHFTVRVSKEVLPSQEMLDTLLNKYIPEELESLYQQVRRIQQYYCHSL